MGKESVTFPDGDLDLVGYLSKPTGDGPFRAIVWNPGNEQNPDSGPEFDAVAKVLVPAGYVVFVPLRRGQGASQGQSLQDQVQQEQKTTSATAAQQFFVDQMAGPQLNDQLAGLAYLKKLPYVDPNRLAAAGCSDGGVQALLAAERGAGYEAAVAISPAVDKNRIATVGCSFGETQTLLGAESNSGYKAAVALSPNAESWTSSPLMQQRLLKAVDNITIPTLVVQPAHDASLEPGFTLGAEFQKLDKFYGLQIYPPFGTAIDHRFGGDPKNFLGLATWGPDALSFLNTVLR